MRVNGNLSVVGLLQDVKIDRLASDPASPALSQVWFNTTEIAMKFYDGVAVQVIATGTGALAEYLKLDGTSAMTGELTLSSNDQSASGATVAVSKGHLDAVAATKQDTLTGATSNLVSADLDTTKAVVTDASGKIIAATSTTAAEVEHLAGVTSGIQSQIDGKEASLGYVPVNKAGDGMSGALAMNTNAISGLPPAAGPTEPVRQAEFELALSGVGKNYGADVHGVQSDNTLDPGAAPTTGDRYILTDTGNLNANFGTITGVADGDIVEWDGSEFVIAFDADVDGEGSLVWDQLSDTYQRFDGTSWQEFGGLSGVTAGIGLGKAGNDIYVNMGAGVAQLPSDEVGIDVKTDGGLFTTVDGSASSTDTAAQLAILVDGDSVETTATGLKVKAAGITESMLNTSVVGNGLQGAGGAALAVLSPASSGITVDGTGVSVDDVEMRTRALYRDGAEAMTGVLTLSSNDQSGDADTAAISKGHLDAAIATAGTATTTLETRLENGYFLYEEIVTPSASHAVTHNMNQKYVQVSVVDSSDEIVIPESITFTDANNLTVTFSSPEVCRIIVTGLKVAV